LMRSPPLGIIAIDGTHARQRGGLRAEWSP
jgi:hypothetical protein